MVNKFIKHLPSCLFNAITIKFIMRYAFVGVLNTLFAWGLFELFNKFIDNHISFVAAFVCTSALNIYLHGKITLQDKPSFKKYAMILSLYGTAFAVSYLTFHFGVLYGLSDTIAYLITIPAYQLTYGTSLYIIYIVSLKK